MDPARGGRDPLLPLAVASSLVLVAISFAPPFPGRILPALVGGLWAPGYALVALAAPRGRLAGLERHALTLAAGLLLVPPAAIATSLLVGFSPERIAVALLLVTLAMAIPAWRRGAADEPATRSLLPGTRATLAVSGGAFLLAAALLAPSLFPAPAPSALALTTPVGAEVPLRWPIREPPTLVVEAMAPDSPAEGELVVSWTDLDANATILLLVQRVDLAAGGSERVEISPPEDADAGVYRLAARWDGREVHATVRVGETR